jgi:hypothetical protein
MVPADGVGCGVSPTAVGVTSGLTDGAGCAVVAAAVRCDPDVASASAVRKKNAATVCFTVLPFMSYDTV